MHALLSSETQKCIDWHQAGKHIVHLIGVYFEAHLFKITLTVSKCEQIWALCQINQEYKNTKKKKKKW
jgi:hypothetical protein